MRVCVCLVPTNCRGGTCAQSWRGGGAGLSGSRERRSRRSRRRATGAPGLRSPRWSQQEPSLSSSRCSASETAHRLPVSPRRSKDGRRKESRKKRGRRSRRKTELAYFLSRTLVTRITGEKWKFFTQTVVKSHLLVSFFFKNWPCSFGCRLEEKDGEKSGKWFPEDPAGEKLPARLQS